MVPVNVLVALFWVFRGCWWEDHWSDDEVGEVVVVVEGGMYDKTYPP